ncbi:hypothetical protein K439DRAFT_390714 [Ramaria rubella]|nr:hypothetical protein K439DRAFT_390714 [Ramaria rubella]
MPPSLEKVFAKLQINHRENTRPPVSSSIAFPHCYVPSAVITDTIVDTLINVEKTDSGTSYCCVPVSWEPQRTACRNWTFHNRTDARDHIRSCHWLPGTDSPSPVTSFFCLACGATFESERSAKAHVRKYKADNRRVSTRLKPKEDRTKSGNGA